MDTRRRAWAKAITWRIAGVGILGAITYVFTGNWKESSGITISFNIVRFILYYLHERIWDRFKWGTLKHPLQHLRVRKNLTSEDYAVIEKMLDTHQFSSKEPEYQI